jgi:hypothetical protein
MVGNPELAELAELAAANLPSALSSAGTGDGMPPQVRLIQMAVAIWTSRAIYAAATLGIADHLADAPQTANDLALATATHAPSLRRLLRALGSCGIVSECDTGRYALTPLGAALKTGAPGAARATVLTLAGDWQWKAWDEFLFSLRTGRPAMSEALGLPLFEYLASHPSDALHFQEAMVGMHGALAPTVVAAYDFSRFSTAVDLGGGTGSLLTAILQANRDMRGVLFERPEVVPEARRCIDATRLLERCDVVAGNFFASVPRGHDVYILSHVLHDWTDSQALPILRNCRQAISSGGRLLIVEIVLPPGDTPHHGKLMDLLMLTITGGVERTAEEFAHLLGAAGFGLAQVISTSSHDSLLEAVPL